MSREKKKSWRDYEYCSYQFRTSEVDKNELESLLGQLVEKANMKLEPDDKKFTRGELATKLLKEALQAELRHYD